MKILFAASLLLAVAASGVYSQACHLREIDLCMAIGMFHYQSNGLPPDEEKVNEWCETMTEVRDCMGNFSSKCISPLQREVLGLLSGSGDEAVQLCTAGTEIRANYLKYSECLAEGAESDNFRAILKDLQVMVEKLFEVNYKQRFPLLCCGFGRLHADTDELVRGRCGEPAVEMVRGVMHMITTQLPETICQRFDVASDECQGLLPPKGSQTKGGENKSQLSKLLETMLGSN